jgi:hypothetical protein
LLCVALGSSLAVSGAWGIGVFALVAVLALYIHKAKSLLSLGYIALTLPCLMCLIGLLLPPVAGSGGSPQGDCRFKMFQISNALRAYHETKGCFPPAYVADKNGKPIHSWRVLLLPYLGEIGLYKAYDFNEPWDGPNNRKLLAKRPSIYACPADPRVWTPDCGQTSYLAVVGPKAARAGEKSRAAPGDFPAGTFKTVMVVEAVDSGIAWTEPRDLILDERGTLFMGLSSNHGRHKDFFSIADPDGGVVVAMADSSTNYLPLGNLSLADQRKNLESGGCIMATENYERLFSHKRRPNWPNIAALAVWLLSVGLLLTHAVRSRKRPSAPATPAAG